jgi:hypothetical protein
VVEEPPHYLIAAVLSLLSFSCTRWTCLRKREGVEPALDWKKKRREKRREAEQSNPLLPRWMKDENSPSPSFSFFLFL